jgi:hypothetical protein
MAPFAENFSLRASLSLKGALEQAYLLWFLPWHMAVFACMARNNKVLTQKNRLAVSEDDPARL